MNDIEADLLIANAKIKQLEQQLADYHHMSELVNGKMAENARLRRINEKLTARAEAAEAERDACKADLKSMADWYRDSVCDDGICGWCKQDADHGLDGYANECAGFYKNDCFEWRGQEAGKEKDDANG